MAIKEPTICPKKSYNELPGSVDEGSVTDNHVRIGVHKGQRSEKQKGVVRGRTC